MLHDQVDEHDTSEGLSTKGYMKLIGRQEPTPDRYTKTIQTKMDNVDGKPMSLITEYSHNA